MIKIVSTLQALLIIVLFSSCNSDPDQYKIEITNSLDHLRNTEMVEITKSDVDGMLCETFSRLGVKDLKTGEFLPSQVIDGDLDGKLDVLIFQPVLEAGETRKYLLVPQENPVDYSDMEARTFSRFVPERTDDYAWENERVAFRTYGPTAQKMVEDKVKGGTLSSGMDCWLKRVDYPIIDKWYKKTEEGGSYHKDTGEGLDDYHVGPSRGCGGIGIWSEDEKKLYTSRNFSDWRTVTEGPLRTQFELDYQPWEGPSGEIIEKKIISLDMGSNLMRIEVHIQGTEEVTAGLTLHEKDGNIEGDEKTGCFSYWQPHGDSELGMGIIVPAKYLKGYTEHITDEKDLSHVLVHMKPVDGKLVYYAGFGWKKSGLYTSEEEWINHLKEFAANLESELILKVYQ